MVRATTKEKEKPRIFFFLPGFEKHPTGGYRVVYEYANYLAESDKYIVSVVHSRALIGKHLGNHSKFLFLRSLKSTLRSTIARRPGRPISWFRMDRRVTVKFTTFLPAIPIGSTDILIATAAQTAPYVSRLAQAHGATGVYFIQSYEDWSMPKAFVDQTWRLPLYRIAIAPWLAEIAESFGLDASVVANAIRPDEFPAGDRLVDRRRSVMALVSTSRNKRTDLVEEVFAALTSSDPSVRMTTFGTCPRPVGLPASVVHLRNPSRSELAAAYRNSRVYLCASDSEGWGLPPAEALMSGTAVVSTDIGGVRSYASEAALFSPPGKSSPLFANVKRLLNEDDLAQRLTDRGRTSLLSYGPKEAARRFVLELQTAARVKHTTVTQNLGAK